VEIENMDITSGLIAIVIFLGSLAFIVKAAEYVTLMFGVIAGYIFSCIFIVIGIYIGGLPGYDYLNPIVKSLFPILCFGGVVGLVNVHSIKAVLAPKNNIGSTNLTPAPTSTSPVSVPAASPHMVINYTDNSIKNVHIDNSVKNISISMSREEACEVLGLPKRFTTQRLEKAYEDKIEILELKAQSLPKGDKKGRLLIEQQEQTFEKAYEFLNTTRSN
jgi:hypothetical protein